MSYLEEMQEKLTHRDYSGFLQLWEEYCHGDTLDPKELIAILKNVVSSEFAQEFNKQLPSALELWRKIEDEEFSYQVFRLIIDLQTSNNPELREMTYEILKKRYGHLPDFNEKLRLIGLRSKESFKGAVSSFELLNHMKKGKFVFHTGGWGTGEIMELSLLREELTLEFEKVLGRKDLSFENAFKNLIPLPDTHFLARRFGDPDGLEQEAKQDPVSVIRLLLQDLGPKTTAEIKDELCEWVIPEEEWSKWWQTARAKVKKDTLIESPASLKDPFRLRNTEVSHEDRFIKALNKKQELVETVEFIYQQLRDFSQLSKSQPLIETTNARLMKFLAEPLSEAYQLQILYLQEEMNLPVGEKIRELIAGLATPLSTIEQIPIAAFKKKALVNIREARTDWQEIFKSLFLTLPHPTLREYLLKELNQPNTTHLLKEMLERLLSSPEEAPELFVWYFQKIVGDEPLPYANKEGRRRFFESFLTLLPRIENINHYRELVKKMHSLISSKRFAIVRKIIEGASIEYLQEILLLVSKCASLSDHDVKILNSLAEVVQPSLAKEGRTKASHQLHDETIWTTKEGFLKVQNRIQQIGTVETVENAKEIEAARALGDLRENSEYKFALERRARLQGELKLLSTQIHKARLITEQDIPKEEVGVGSVVFLKNAKDQEFHYTLLGPWDADPEKNILSFQSKFAQAMKGKKVGEIFDFQGEEYTVMDIKSYLEVKQI